MLSVPEYDQTLVSEEFLELLCPRDRSERDDVAFDFQLLYSSSCFDVIARNHPELEGVYPLVVSALIDELYQIICKVKKIRISHRGNSHPTRQGADGEQVHEYYEKATVGFSVRDYAICEQLLDGDYQGALKVYLSSFAAFRFEKRTVNGRTILAPWIPGTSPGAAQQTERRNRAKTKAQVGKLQQLIRL